MSTNTIDQTTINEWLHPVGQSVYAIWRGGYQAGLFESLLQRGQPFEFNLHGLPLHIFEARATAMNRTVTFCRTPSELECLVMVSGT